MTRRGKSSAISAKLDASASALPKPCPICETRQKAANGAPSGISVAAPSSAVNAAVITLPRMKMRRRPYAYMIWSAIAETLNTTAGIAANETPNTKSLIPLDLATGGKKVGSTLNMAWQMTLAKPMAAKQ